MHGEQIKANQPKHRLRTDNILRHRKHPEQADRPSTAILTTAADISLLQIILQKPWTATSPYRSTQPDTGG